MNRGYIKFWRKAQDSSSWNRGLMYQGLIINLLTRAAWKKSSYQGRDILPGQFGTVMSQLAESLQVARTTLQRMVAHLEADNFLRVENVGNRFVIVTILNWGSYQENETSQRATNGQQTVNQRAANGQPSYNEEEVKKEERNNHPVSSLENKEPARVEDNAEADTGCADEPSIDFLELRQFWNEHFRPEGPLAGFGEYKQLRSARAYPGDSRIYADLQARIDCQFWNQGFAISLARYLRERTWETPPKARAAPEQKSWQEREDEANFNAFVAEAKVRQAARERGVAS